MTLKTRSGYPHFPTVGIDAVSLERYSEINTANGELIIYDEENPDGWVQCDFWIAAESME